MTTLDVGHTIRQPATALFTVDSEDRWAGGYPEARLGSFLYSDPFSFTLPGNATLLSGFFTRIGVSEVVMPWCPNINPKTNTILVKYQVSGSPIETVDVVLPNGYFTPADIASDIQQKVRLLDAGLSGFTMTYGGDNYPHFLYATTNTTTIAFLPLDYNSDDYPYPVQTKQLFDLLGFTVQNTNLNIAGQGGYTLCQSIRYVDIICPYLTQYQGVFDGSTQPNNRDSLCRVYLDGYVSQVKPSDATFIPPGTAPAEVYRNFTNPKQIQWIGKQNITQNLLFQVYGDDGQLFSTNFGATLSGGGGIDTRLNVNWSMSLLVSEN